MDVQESLSGWAKQQEAALAEDQDLDHSATLKPTAEKCHTRQQPEASV